MKLPRRNFLHLVAGAVALPAASCIAWAQAYPTRPVRIIVGFPAGGANDIVARLMGEWLSQRLGQPFVIENRPGAATNIAAETVVKARPDGYTIFMASTTNTINATLYDKLSFNFIRDMFPIAMISSLPLVIVVNPAVPVTTAGRSDALPDVTTVGEFVPGYEASAWFGVGAPKSTPAEIVDKLNKEINAGLADPKIKARLSDLGGTPLVGSPADFAKHIADETEKWGKVIRAANIKPE